MIKVSIMMGSKAGCRQSSGEGARKFTTVCLCLVHLDNKLYSTNYSYFEMTCDFVKVILVF